MKTKNPFKILARKVVILWTKYIYNKAVKIADRRYREEHTMIYVVSKPFRPDLLVTLSKREFKAMKLYSWGYRGRLLTLQTLRNGCYYHTPDPVGNQSMDDNERARRLKYFIKERLIKAKLW